MQTVMVYRLDEKTLSREPVGILVERRKSERGNNVVGLLRLAREQFAESEEESRRILIGDYV